MQSKTWARLGKSIFACVCSALLGAAAFVLYRAVKILIHNQQHDASSQHAPNFWDALTRLNWPQDIMPAIVGLSVMIFVGMPVQALLQKFKFTGLIVVIIASAFVGGLFGQFLTDFIQQMNAQDDNIPYLQKFSAEAVGSFALLSMFYGSLFWLIRRPDLDDKLQTRTVKPL
ncbi:hypothetical protein Q1W73_04350 [Asticcacaulis sp. ZE23SCel15]|uniref:hypothetical protein n=1 Tax=Asticcacaulis sp. ZE23SCel15 TaxID=3059027 RepID=UPI00265F83C7|nr:hypothetical protein [Asticcacaulis sp. ZE23SCel15]WKL58218.1 hypothetical protein Q1W73_04350 [Asticcacaulis sp. ZE23SCel15]